MHFLKKLTMTLMGLMLTIAAAAPASADTTILRLTHNAGTGQSIYDACEYLAQIVNERTDGRIEIQIFPNNILGPDLATRDMLSEGSVDLQSIGYGFLSSWAPAMNISQNLYAFESEDELHGIMTGDFGQTYFFEPFLKERNIRILDQWPQSARQLISKKPVRGPADLKGLKLRTPPGLPVWEDAWARLGVMSLSLALEDAFTGMQQGVCDAVEMPVDFIRSYRFHEEAKYLTMTNHNLYEQFFLINESSFQRLSPEDQQILTQAVLDAGKFAYQERLESEQAIIEEFKAAGVEIIELSPETLLEFQKIVDPIYKARIGDLWDEATYTAFTSAVQKYRDAHSK